MGASNGRKEERETDNQIIELDTDMIDATKSVCRIMTNEGEGTGFLLKTFKGSKEFFCLLTNEHVINKGMIEAKQKVIIHYDKKNKTKEITLDKEKRFIKEYREKDLDITLVEIIKEDDIKEKYFLLSHPSNNITDKKIYIIQYPHGVLSYSKGKILNIDKFELEYDVGTKPGSSGSPIFLEGTKLVIGIHKQGDELKKVNYGDLLYPIIQDLEQQSENKNENIKHKDNIINDNYEEDGIL